MIKQEKNVTTQHGKLLHKHTTTTDGHGLGQSWRRLKVLQNRTMATCQRDQPNRRTMDGENEKQKKLY